MTQERQRSWLRSIIASCFARLLARRSASPARQRRNVARIWTDRDDGYWFYVEQAAASNPGKPCRQRVYRLSQVWGDLFKSEVFLIPNPGKHVGEWRSEKPLLDVSPDTLEPRSGCTVFLRLDARGEFTGGTGGRSCASKLRGAAYATSTVVIGPGRIESWDRGFDEHGRQVGGATLGPYVFIRYAGVPSTRGMEPPR